MTDRAFGRKPLATLFLAVILPPLLASLGQQSLTIAEYEAIDGDNDSSLFLAYCLRTILAVVGIYAQFLFPHMGSGETTDTYQVLQFIQDIY